MFEVYMLVGGPRILEGSQRISIMQAVFDKCQTFSEIQKATDLPKSSVYTFLKKLVEEGYLEHVEKEGGVATYRPNCLRLLTSVPVKMKDDHSIPLLNDLPYHDKLERWIVANLLHRSNISGLSIEPMLKYLCYLFGRKIYKIDSENGLECSYERILGLMSEDEFSSVSCIPGKEMTFKAHLEITPEEHSLRQYSVLVFSVICSYLGHYRGKNYRVGNIDLSEWKNNDVIIEIEEVPYEEYGDYTKFTTGLKEDCDFTIYYAKERFIPVIGDVMNKLVEFISTIPMSSQQLAKRLDLPQSTVSGYLKKLENDGVIAQKKLHKKIEYYLTSIKAMDWTGDVLNDVLPLTKILESAAVSHRHFVRYLFHGILYLSHLLGLDVEVWMNFVGKRAGKRIVEYNPGCNMEELFDKIVERGEDTFSSSVAILSCSPLTVTKIYNEDLSDFLAEYYRIMFNSMFVSFMETISGISYRVKSSSIYGDGNRGYRTCIIPSLS